MQPHHGYSPQLKDNDFANMKQAETKGSKIKLLLIMLISLLREGGGGGGGGGW